MNMVWFYIGIFLIVSLGLPAVAIFLASLLAPKKPSALKSTIYECGLETEGETWVQFKAQYYLIALIFLVFDIEIIFLYPWAVAFDRLGLFAVLEGLLFITILAGGLIYAWKKGAFEWA
ncbi:MAG: NADH-quinone oxidoreductase subunit A [Anaerolinea sp.]|nr:NADH-quinone oxidoreductase subunit A [Anaerolinea sp.]